MACGKRGFPQLGQAAVCLGLLAWWARFEFLRAFESRLRGTAMS